MTYRDRPCREAIWLAAATGGWIADPWVSANEHHGAGHHAAAEDPVELPDAGGNALVVFDGDFDDGAGDRALGAERSRAAATEDRATWISSVRLFQLAQSGHLPSHLIDS